MKEILREFFGAIKQSLIKVTQIKFDLHIIVNKTELPDLAPLGTQERVEQTDQERNKYRRLHKEAATAYQNRLRFDATMLMVDREREREIDSR